MEQINTINTKDALRKGGFRTGNPQSKDVILIVASCRGIPHLNYLNRYNNDHGQPFYICYIDPYNFRYGKNDELLDHIQSINEEVASGRMNDILSRTTILIHEHYQSYGKLNTSKHCDENIFQIGLNPRLRISIPNWNAMWVFFQDMVSFNEELKNHVRNNGGALQQEMFEKLKASGLKNIEGWKFDCRKTSFPEFVEYFEETWQHKRMFNSLNHVTFHYTVPLFSMLCRKFLGIRLGTEYENMLYEYDLFSDKGGTQITKYDIDAYRLKWDEETVELTT